MAKKAKGKKKKKRISKPGRTVRVIAVGCFGGFCVAVPKKTKAFKADIVVFSNHNDTPVTVTWQSSSPLLPATMSFTLAAHKSKVFTVNAANDPTVEYFFHVDCQGACPNPGADPEMIVG